MNNVADEVAIESFDEHTQQEQTQEILQIQQEIDKLNDIKQQVQKEIEAHKNALNLCDLELKKLEENGSKLDSDLLRLNEPSSRLNPDPLNLEFKQQELDKLKVKQQELNLMSQARIRDLRMREVKKIPLSIPNEVLVNEGARLMQQQDLFKRLVLKRLGSGHDLSEEQLEEIIRNEGLQLANYKNAIIQLEQELAEKSELLRELRKTEEALKCKTAEYEEAIIRYETVGKLEQSMKRKIQQLDEEGNIHQREIDKIRQNQLLRKDAEKKLPQLRQKKDSSLLLLLVLLIVLTAVAIFFQKNFFE